MLILPILLSIYSLVILNAIDNSYVIPQFVAIIIGIFLYILLRSIDSKVFQKFWPFWYLVSVLILALSLLGPEVRGAHRWIEIAGQRIQPSEIIKPFFAISLAGLLDSRYRYNVMTFFQSILLLIPPFIIIFEQPDLGNAIVLLTMFGAVIAVSQFGLKYVFIPVVIGVTTLPILWHFLEAYQKIRITTFFNPEYDMQGVGYNARQALIAVGSGGFFGKGLGQGTQSKLEFLPEFHTDFIFASTVEQLGFIGGFILLVCYFLLLMQLLKTARNGDEYTKLLSIAIFMQLFTQIFINIGMNIGLVPITGITLPLFSFGGSSVLATFMALALISNRRKKENRTISIH